MCGYLRYSLSFRDVEELLSERGLKADHTTIWRWVQRYGPELEERLRRHLKPTNKSWRVDETYVHVNGRWCYLYRAIDSTGATIDFVLSGLRDAATAKRLFRKALTDPSHPQPRVINTDQARLYGAAISGVKQEGIQTATHSLSERSTPGTWRARSSRTKREPLVSSSIRVPILRVRKATWPRADRHRDAVHVRPSKIGLSPASQLRNAPWHGREPRALLALPSRGRFLRTA